MDLETATVADVGAAMAAGRTTSEELVGAYLERIDRLNPLVNAIRCLAPDAEERAAALDAERADGRVRGPLHGVPVLVKDNIDVAGLPTTAGALALEHSVPDRDADLVVRLREAGAVVIGKTNLTEMANCMAEGMPSGYSSLGGQVLNPYDVRFDPSGSSSGSGAAAALGLATVTVGTETDGSILSPASNQSLVGVKPTLGLVPGTGVLPIASSQDCAGPMCRTVADAAALLGGADRRDVRRGAGHAARRAPGPAAGAGRPDRAGARGLPGRPGRAPRAGRGPRRRAGAARDRRAPGAAARVRPRPGRLPRAAAGGCPDPDHAGAGRLERRARRRGAEVRPGPPGGGRGGRPRGRRRGVPHPAGARPRRRRRARDRRDAGGRRRGGHRLPRAGRLRDRGPGGLPQPGRAGRLHPRADAGRSGSA